MSAIQRPRGSGRRPARPTLASGPARLDLDAALTVRAAHGGIAPFFGVAPSVLTGRPFLELVHPDDREQVSRELTAPEPDGAAPECRVGDPAAELSAWRWVQLVAEEVRVGNGGVHRYLLVDIGR